MFTYEPEWTFLQIFVNIELGVAFCCYLVHFKPFRDYDQNPIQLINECAFVIISYHQLLFTDFAGSAEIKSKAGWSMVICGIVNLVFPNIFYVVMGMIPSIKEAIAEKFQKPLSMK